MNHYILETHSLTKIYGEHKALDSIILSSNVKLIKTGIKALKLKRNNRTQLVKIGGM